MKRTSVVIGFFIAALVLGLYAKYSSVVPTAKEREDTSSAGKETFFQREKGMPVGDGEPKPIDGTMPLLGSDPRPTPERPYEMANDNELFLFQNNKISADCCPSPFATGGGCVCLTGDQAKMLASRGGNRA